MKTSTRRARRPDKAIALALWFLGIAMLGLWCVPSPGRAESSITAAEFRKQRPANFYREIFSRDAAVCGPILQSLNQPYARAQGSREEQRALMYTSFQSEEWRPKHVNWVTADGRKVLQTKDQLIADINNDGHRDAIYRWRGSLTGIVSEDLAVSLNPNDDELSGGTLSFDAFEAILVPVNAEAVGGPVSFSRKTVRQPEAEIPENQLFWWEVISLGSRTYLMSSEAVYWRPTAVTSVLQYLDPASLSLICQFRGVLNIIR